MEHRRVRLSLSEIQLHFIPEVVLEQLRFHLNSLPDDIRRMVDLLFESGIRVSELCTLPFDCLVQDESESTFLRYLESRTKIVRTIPLSSRAVRTILEQQQSLKDEQNGERSFLFPNPKGLPSSVRYFMKTLNRLASEKNICDIYGTIWRFRAHQIHSTVRWRLFQSFPLSVIAQLLHHRTIEVQPDGLLRDGVDAPIFERPADSLLFGYCAISHLEGVRPLTLPYPLARRYVRPIDPLLLNELEALIQDSRKWLFEGGEYQNAADEPQEIEEHDFDDEKAFFALGRMRCVACEQRETVPGSTRCQECIKACACETQWASLFELGRIFATRGAIETMERRGVDYYTLLARHMTGDWGDLDEEDKRENEFAVNNGQRIHSSYGTRDNPDRLWIITEADRSITTILLPDDY